LINVKIERSGKAKTRMCYLRFLGFGGGDFFFAAGLAAGFLAAGFGVGFAAFLAGAAGALALLSGSFFTSGSLAGAGVGWAGAGGAAAAKASGVAALGLRPRRLG
jgi:hypothetical protein